MNKSTAPEEEEISIYIFLLLQEWGKKFALFLISAQNSEKTIGSIKGRQE
jgi:hypothetical protein